MGKVVEVFELHPVDCRKSFYGKALVKVYDDGTEVLQSYKTDVMKRKPDGTLVRLWWDWSATTGRHIYAFVGCAKQTLTRWNMRRVENAW